MKNWFLLSLITVVLWGFWGFLPKLTTQYISPKSALLYQVIGTVIVGIVALATVHFRPETHPRGVLLGIITGIAAYSGAMAFLYAISKYKASVVIPMTALYPLVAILLSYVFLHEPITVKQGIGIFLALGAMVLFAF
ncbi:MAG: EamA family transporter [Spirochaetota bacterium]|nr:MAG: EamA family transporter [Spirochaetota bacterium]